MLKIALSFLVWIFLTINLAYGFDSPEHKKMGNLAYKVALAYAKEYEPIKNKIDVLQIDRLLLHNPSYGEIAMCVDFFLYPEKILANAWANNQETELDGLPSIKHPISVDAKKHCSVEGTRFMQSTHNNHAHFQQDLLMSFNLYHLLAISVAKEGHNIYAAIVINAISDHYLQDIFAPGHIVTPRYALSDVPATAMHDLANNKGIYFYPSDFKGIDRILDYICGTEKNDRDSPELPLSECHLNDDLKRDLIGQGIFLNLDEAINTIKKHQPILFLGDGHLDMATQDQLTQRIFLLAIEIKSILDIFEGANSFTKYGWKFEPNELLVKANVPFGEYRLTRNLTEINAGKSGTSNSTALKKEKPQTGNNVPSSGESKTNGHRPYTFGTFSPIFGVSLHRESMSNGARMGRNVGSVETIPFGGIVTNTPWAAIPSFSFAPVFGYSAYQEGDIRGSGPTLRIIGSVPETEFSFGPYARWLSYPTKDGDKRQISLGGRMDSGFSSYGTFFLGVGRDYGTTPVGILENGWLWTAGFELAFPVSRLRK